MITEDNKYKELNNKEEIYDSIINNFMSPHPSSKDLRLSVSDYRIEEYSKVMQKIWSHYELDFSILLLTPFIIIWLLIGKIILFDIFYENYFLKYVGGFIIIICGIILFLIYNHYREKATYPFIKWKFKKLNAQNPTSAYIQYMPHGYGLSDMPIKKFSQDELTEIKQYILFLEEYEKVRLKAKNMIKQSNLLD